MPTWTLILVVCLFVAMDAVVLFAVFGGLRSAWNGALASHEPTDPAPEAIRKRHQSFKLGLFNLGYSIEVVVDAEHLHLIPMRIPRKIGLRPASVPWDAIELKQAKKRWAKVRIGSNELQCPAWCVEMLRETAPGDASR